MALINASLMGTRIELNLNLSLFSIASTVNKMYILQTKKD